MSDEQKQEQYGEPWEVGSEGVSGGYANLYDRYGNLTAQSHSCDDLTDEDAEERAARIVACVNACAGIADPMELRRKSTAWQKALDYWQGRFSELYDRVMDGTDNTEIALAAHKFIKANDHAEASAKMQTIADLRRQRDELLAACKEAMTWFDRANEGPSVTSVEMFRMLEVAIANAK